MYCSSYLCKKINKYIKIQGDDELKAKEEIKKAEELVKE